MTLEVNVHAAQTAILRELLFRPQAGYAELQRPTGLTSDHFSFHVAKLVELGLVDKVARGKYKLTARGKEYANKLDTDQNTIERQPKCAVMLCIEKQINGKRYFLLQERLKHPYFGFWGVPTGKIRWGETILQTAARELMEETGLEADFRYVGIYHEHAYQKESGELLEDKIFHVVHCQNPRGKLTEEFEGGRNTWMTKREASATAKKFDSVDIELSMVDKEYAFVENIVTYSSDQF
jgi:ADP-ribose pyrophosphatase YjhB (NUDIX family)